MRALQKQAGQTDRDETVDRAVQPTVNAIARKIEGYAWQPVGESNPSSQVENLVS